MTQASSELTTLAAVTPAMVPVEPIIIDYEPQMADFVEASTLGYRRKIIRMTLLLVMIAAMEIGIAALLPPIAEVMLISAATVLFVGALTPFRYRNVFRKYWKRHPHLAEPKRLALTADSFSSASYNASVLMRWEAFTHFIERKRLFILYRGPLDATPIVKRAMSSEVVEQVRTLLKIQIGRAKYQSRQRAFPVAPIHPALRSPNDTASITRDGLAQ